MKPTEPRYAPLLVALFLTGCAAQLPIVGPSSTRGPTVASPGTTPADAAVVRRPIDATQPPADAAVVRRPIDATQPPTGDSALHAAADALYVCVTDKGGQRNQTAIEFAPKVAALCSRHPEMGPCQYERQQCRNRGGRVFLAGGQEITRAIEDAYDRKVMRVRFRAN